MIITRKNPFTGKVQHKEINVTEQQLDRWSSGVLIQDCMPHLTPGEREYIMTGLTDEDWDQLFNEVTYG